METTLIRGFVLMLVLTGFGASTISSRGAAKHNGAHANDMPVPVCLPSDPSKCGLDIN